MPFKQFCESHLHGHASKFRTPKGRAVHGCGGVWGPGQTPSCGPPPSLQTKSELLRLTPWDRITPPPPRMWGPGQSPQFAVYLKDGSAQGTNSEAQCLSQGTSLPTNGNYIESLTIIAKPFSLLYKTWVSQDSSPPHPAPFNFYQSCDFKYMSSRDAFLHAWWLLNTTTCGVQWDLRRSEKLWVLRVLWCCCLHIKRLIC